MGTAPPSSGETVRLTQEAQCQAGVPTALTKALPHGAQGGGVRVNRQVELPFPTGPTLPESGFGANVINGNLL